MIIEFANTTPAWCPGCGDYSILDTLKTVFEKAHYDPHKFVLVSGIGQAAKLPHYMDINVFNGLHGRALPAATGIKIANHQLEVIITSGDGDMYGEGGNHLLHAIRRNIGVKAFVHNNQVYGLTKGQASPTSDPGFVTPIQNHGVKASPVNPLCLAIIEECTFVARSFSGDKEHLAAMMKAAIEHKHGFALLDILQPCVSFNHHNTFAWYKERVRKIPASHDPNDKMQALELAMQWGDEIPIGIFYKSKRKSFEEANEVLQKGPLVKHYLS
ncbi:2-oxoacid:ferredoxin oxidoreductase subunit beta [Lentisphaerota bacterium ZTH]|nr:2-oxoacid:ferredoxin oxidoreductase subunit beta [Lentisphaerota bacterium]WET06576.1 2-oxoacid:ferredoxin oxidoreductase subunit beta [Lentisphaerota bacterium ZTH]